VQIFQRGDAGALIGSEIALVGLNQQIMEPREDDLARGIAINFLTGGGDQFLFLFLVGAEIAF
jgi:hypothetical protein